MSTLRAIVRREHGVAMVLVVSLYAMLVLLGVTLIATVLGEGERSASAVQRSASFQSAEAGVDDYVAKLVDDPLYYGHYVHPGEATRQASDLTTVSAGQTWAYDLTWSYPNGNDTWRQLSNGYEYSLQIFPPTGTSPTLRIVSTGRRQGSATDVRRVEVYIRPSSIADFQRIVNGNVNWGPGATTYGKLYSAGSISHEGAAQGNIYAEGQITGSVAMQNGAQRYDVDSNPDIRSEIENPINFASFLTSLVDVQRAAEVGGIKLDDSTKAAWRLTFVSDGTVQVQSCTAPGGNPVYQNQPTCSTVPGSPFPVPANGAIYAAQTAIVQGQVKGRVTVASNDDVVIAADIAPVTPGDDVLGLNAYDDVIAASWGPVNLTWQAAVLAQTGTWWGAGGSAGHDTMTFTGSAVTQDGGSWSGMFETRNYYYDETLLFLPPPWFPTVEDVYTVALFRELKPS